MKRGHLAERLEPARQAMAKLDLPMTDAEVAIAETNGRAAVINLGDYRKILYTERRKPQS